MPFRDRLRVKMDYRKEESRVIQRFSYYLRRCRFAPRGAQGAGWAKAKNKTIQKEVGGRMTLEFEKSREGDEKFQDELGRISRYATPCQQFDR